MILGIGVLTVFIASLSEKTQSNIKGQLAYASIAQVGLMFVALSLGLLHFISNVFLCCYQLLVSPSIVANLLRVESAVDSDFYIKDTQKLEYLPLSIRDVLPEVLQNTLYVFALQEEEGQLELLVRKILWEPLKNLGATMNRLSVRVKGLSILAVMIWFRIAVSAVVLEFPWIGRFSDYAGFFGEGFAVVACQQSASLVRFADYLCFCSERDCSSTNVYTLIYGQAGGGTGISRIA